MKKANEPTSELLDQHQKSIERLTYLVLSLASRVPTLDRNEAAVLDLLEKEHRRNLEARRVASA